MRLLTFLEYAAIVVGAIGMVAAKFYYLPKGVHLGLFLIGVGFALGGLESLVTRRMSFRFSTRGGEAYAGAPAVIWGLIALLIGAAVIASAYLMEQGLWRSAVDYLARRPGPAIIAFGFLFIGVGTLLMFNRRSHGIVWMLIVRVPKTLLGVVLIVAGLLAIGVGLWELFHPRAFSRLSRTILHQFGLAPFEYYWKRILGPLR